MARAIWRRTGRCMYPASEEAEEMLASIKHGQEVLGEFKAARNVRQLRLYWAICTILAGQDIFPTKEAASNGIKFAVGHVDTVIMPDTGEIELVPQSIAFESMKQADFNSFFAAAIRAVCTRWLPGVDDETLKREVYEMCDGVERTSLGRRVA